MRLKHIKVSLSRLSAASSQGRRNPRRVRPDRDAHARLVASIRSLGFFSVLVVRPTKDPERFAVVAGNRRLAALKEVHKGADDPQVPCIVMGTGVDQDSGAVQADAVALAENFVREPMHPLDEAEAFATLAGAEGKGPEAIAAEFAVTEHYVRQRMKLAALSPVVKAAYREGKIDTGMAEAFAAVPAARQEEIWEETGGNPRHAQYIRHVIASTWVDAKHAIFDLGELPEASVSRDLFNDQVIVERAVFLEAQARAVEAERATLLEDGWADAVAGKREDLYGKVSAMAAAERAFEPKVRNKLERLAARRAKLEASLEVEEPYREGIEDEEAEAQEEAAPEDEEADRQRARRVYARLEKLDAAEQALIEAAPVMFAEETKAVGTAFLMLSADGSVTREYRVPRQARTKGQQGGHTGGEAGEDAWVPVPRVPTSDDLADRQLSTVFTHRTLAVREAVLKDDSARKRVLALLLHDKVRSEGLAIRPEVNGVTLHASREEGFVSPAFQKITTERGQIDPLVGKPHVSDIEAYEAISKMSEKKLDRLIQLLIVESLTCHALRETSLIGRLAGELEVDVRKHWRPDAAWLGAFRKIQLTHLLGQLYGPIYSPSGDNRKKSELVAAAAKLFTDAAEGTLSDAVLAERVNRWTPANLRPVTA